MRLFQSSKTAPVAPRRKQDIRAHDLRVGDTLYRGTAACRVGFVIGRIEQRPAGALMAFPACGAAPSYLRAGLSVTVLR